MTTQNSQNTTAHVIVKALAAQGVCRLFAVAGESYLALLDALVDAQDHLEVITCRHEANAANMAEATGKLTGRPGVVMVTRGPGALHASIALHTAQQDATPMVMLVGQIATQDVGRNAFQELDYTQVFGSICKAVLVCDPRRVGEIMARAFKVAMEGRPGPVLVTLPEDVLEVASNPVVWPAVARSRSALSALEVAEITRLLTEAHKPLLWIGGSGWDADGLAAVRRLAEHTQSVVVSGFRRKDLFDNHHPQYVGECGFSVTPAVEHALRDCDLWLVLGSALGDVETGGYTRLTVEQSVHRVVHIAMDPSDVGRVFPVKLGACADLNTATQQLAQAVPAAASAERQRFVADLKALYQSTLAPTPIVGQVHLGEVYRMLRQRLAPQSIVCNGAGNYAAWLHRYFEHRQFPTQLAPQSGAMGYGLGAGIAAALEFPDRAVVIVAGDGCFTMASSDLVTAARCPNVLILVVNNGIYGTIRMHQAARFPGRPMATDLHNPDFVAMAQAAGLRGFRVTATAEFEAVLNQALESGPALIELVTDRRDILPGKILDH